MNNKNMKKRFYFIASHLTLMFAFAVSISAQTTEFTYQGKLTDTGTPTATYDFEFRLCNSLAADCSVPLASQQIPNVPVSGGVFTVKLDFGPTNFDGSNRWLEIAVKHPAQGTFMTLTPRQPLTSAPYSIKSLKSFDAENLGGTAANQFVQITDARLTDARNPLPNSPNYIQNTASPQASSNFNVSGNGIIGGNVGIGTTNPQSKLEVNGEAAITPGGSGGQIFFAAPNGETGMLIRGTSRADIRFDGSSLKLLAGTSTGAPISTNGIIINTSGKVSIGGLNPVPLIGTLSVGAVGFDSAVSGGSIDGYGVYGKSANSTGVYGESNCLGCYGVYGSNSSGGFAGFFNGKTHVGNLEVQGLGTGGTTAVCYNSLKLLATCGSSLRYKTNIASFGFGLNVVNRLRPISFDWRDGGMKDVGFGAEDVAKINPLFVTYNSSGEVEGVKYDRLSVIFVNAFKEQQAQIEQQKSQIEQQQQQIDGLKEIVCSLQPQAKICQ